MIGADRFVDFAEHVRTMVDATRSTIEEDVLEVGGEAAWTQWSALGAGTLGENAATPSSIIDPEAVLLFSLYLCPREERLRDVTYWWAVVGSELLSVQRTKTLLEDFPQETRERLGTFAAWAAAAGDKRWRRYAGDDAPPPERDRTDPDPLTLNTSPSLLLRLRSGFGVSAKADVLAYLLGIAERPATVQDATWATAYSRATVKGALDDLARAGFTEKTNTRPARYFAPMWSWKLLLQRRAVTADQEGFPSWQHWGVLFSFLAHAAHWAQGVDSRRESLSPRARDVFENVRRVFETHRIQVSVPDPHHESNVRDEVARTVRQVAQWIPEHV